MSANRFHVSGQNREITGGKKGEMPAFGFPKWSAVVLDNLPQPQAAFGLDLSKTQVTDAGLEDLAGLKCLQWLNLSDTNVTDAGLKELTGLKSLQTLWLDGTNVTDRGLKKLAGLTSLQWLGLHDTYVTHAGVAELQKALPFREQPMNRGKIRPWVKKIGPSIVEWVFLILMVVAFCNCVFPKFSAKTYRACAAFYTEFQKDEDGKTAYEEPK